VIFGLSSQPNLQPPLHFANSDKLIHAGEYFGLGMLLYPLVRASNTTRSRRFTAVFALVCGMTIAAADENYQRMIPGRMCDFFDWTADSAGMALAQAASLVLARAKGR
jgi:VanZ family protein